jgi:hypothetical protein
VTDARFEDGGDAPLALAVTDAGDVDVVSTLLQDAVFTGADMRFDPKRREFGLLLNRFRWEDRAAAERTGRAYERVRSVLVFQDVLAVRSQGVTKDAGTVLSLLSVGFTAGPDGTGRVVLTLAGDGAVALEVEALNADLRDVTRPYTAVSGKVPGHGA